MAQVTMTICDRHHQQGVDVPGTPRRLVIDDFEAKPDLCDECYGKEVAPLVSFLRGMAETAPSKRPPRSVGRRSRTSKLDTSAVRAWAVENGIEVSPRGRLRQEVIDKYRAATS